MYSVPGIPARPPQTRAMSALATRCVLVLCFLCGMLNADKLEDFPGHVFCTNDSMRILLPRLLGDDTWEAVNIVDSKGEERDCKYVLNRQSTQMIAYSDCMNYQGSSKYLTIQFKHSNATRTKSTYNVSCKDIQGDGVHSLPHVTCSSNFMSITLSQVLPGFAEQASRQRVSTWYVEVTDPAVQRAYTWTTAQAKDQGYSILSDPVEQEFTITVVYNGTGVQKYQQDDHILYLGDISLFFFFYNQRIKLGATMICLPGPYICNATHLTIIFPEFPATLSGLNLDGREIPMDQLAQNGITLSVTKGIVLYIDRSFLQSKCSSSQDTVVATLILTFTYNENPVLMSISPECRCSVPDSGVSVCNSAGYMDVEVLAASTVPKLDLKTVHVRDASCLPYEVSTDKLVFHVPLSGCGTTLALVDGKVMYENELRALWVDLPQSIISRDSEYRLTIRCLYNGSSDVMVMVGVTSLPLVSLAASDGPIYFSLDLFPDLSYASPYRADQYPVVKSLREPAYLEARLLNRNDPNLELVLDDCWATTALLPASLPRWDVVVDGCDNQNDNYRTVFHPVGVPVQYPSHRKRFEVKTFAFVSGGVPMSSLIFFHCTVLVCNVLAPDSALCTKTCPTLRRRREIQLSSKEHLVSLPGPVRFEEFEVSKMNDSPMRDLENYEFPAHFAEATGAIVLFVLVCCAVSVLVYKWKQTARNNALVVK